MAQRLPDRAARGAARSEFNRQDLRATVVTLLRVLVFSAAIVLALYVVGLVAFMVVD